MKNEKYIEPEIAITMFNAKDVITTSGENNEKDGEVLLPDQEW
jgi:hypothetical protein